MSPVERQPLISHSEVLKSQTKSMQKRAPYHLQAGLTPKVFALLAELEETCLAGFGVVF